MGKVEGQVVEEVGMTLGSVAEALVMEEGVLALVKEGVVDAQVEEEEMELEMGGVVAIKALFMVLTRKSCMVATTLVAIMA